MEAVSNRAEAASRTKQQPPGVVLLDLSPPSKHGFEFLEQVRAHPEWLRVPFVVVTGQEFHESDRARLNGIAAKTLRKGAYTRDELLRALSDGLKTSVRTGRHAQNTVG